MVLVPCQMEWLRLHDSVAMVTIWTLEVYENEVPVEERSNRDKKPGNRENDIVVLMCA
jgi:hypothetical protein